MTDKEEVTPGRPADFDSAPQVDKDGVYTLSKDIQAEQKAAGYAPDNQPKAVPAPAEQVEPGTKRDFTGNIVVATAVEHAKDDKPAAKKADA